MAFVQPETWQWIKSPDGAAIQCERLFYTCPGITLFAVVTGPRNDNTVIGGHYLIQIAYFNGLYQGAIDVRTSRGQAATSEAAKVAVEAWLDSTWPEVVAAMGGDSNDIHST